MNLIQKIAVVMVLAALATPLQLTAQSSVDADIVRELKRIGQAVEAIEKAMRLSEDRSRVSLLLQRAELEVAGITSLESQVRTARSSRDQHVAQEEQVRLSLDDAERGEFDEEDEERKAQLRRERQQLSLYMEIVSKQSQAAEQNLFELEDDLARRSEVFDSLKSQIDELLGLE